MWETGGKELKIAIIVCTIYIIHKQMIVFITTVKKTNAKQ